MLSGSWNSNSRDQVISTILRMTTNGHNSSFLNDAYLISQIPDDELNELIDKSEGIDKYMLPYIKSLSEKWGDRGIAAWDWFRMTQLAGWGYVAGYLELEEAYMLSEFSIRLLRENFSSWDEAVDNYLDGYAYWARIDVVKGSYDYTRRVEIYKRQKKIDSRAALYDRSLWKEPVRGLHDKYSRDRFFHAAVQIDFNRAPFR